jgi:hypothetical protein
VLTIRDNDAGGQIQFSAATYAVSEAPASATITLVRTGGAAGPVSVDFSTNDGVGTATAGSDYTPVPPRTVTFAAGVTTRTVTVRIVTDTLDEPNETVAVQLTNPGTGARLGVRNTAVLKIVDNDTGGVVEFSQALYTVSETATSAVITIVRSGGGASAVTVDFATSDGPGDSGAVAGTHYTDSDTTITFAANQTTRTVSVLLPGANTAATGSKFVTLTLSNPGGRATLGPRVQARLKIVDDEPTVQFAFPTYSVTEGGTVSIAVERTGTVGTVIVPFATSDGSGVAGTDYVTRTGSLTFAAGVRTLAFSVRTLPNTRVDGNRTVMLTLGPVVTGTAGAALGDQSTAVLTIRDNDAGGQIQFSAALGGDGTLGPRDTAVHTIVDNDTGGVVQFSAAIFSATECVAAPCNATLTVSRTGGAASGVTVDLVTADGTAIAGVDYVETSGTVTFAANQASRFITVPLLTDVGAQQADPGAPA